MNMCKRCGGKEAWICVRCIDDLIATSNPESAAVPSKDLVDWLDSLPVTTDETRQRVKKAFDELKPD